MTPPLAIIQARMNSRRLPGKMLLPLGGEMLLHRVWRITCDAFGAENVVIAIPAGDANLPLIDAVRDFGPRAQLFVSDRAEWDVLGRFADCAQRHRWDDDAVIVRVTPDDPYKDAGCMRRVAEGCREPVEWGGEAFTLGQLVKTDAALTRFRKQIGHLESVTRAMHDTTTLAVLDHSIDEDWVSVKRLREHLTHAFFTIPAPPALPETTVWSIDTWADYEAVSGQLQFTLLGYTQIDRATWEAQFGAPSLFEVPDGR